MSTWHSIHCVNPTLPNEGDRVLVYDLDWGVQITVFDTWSEQPAGPLVGGSVTCGPWFLDYDNVTHWTPLPEPPR